MASEAVGLKDRAHPGGVKLGPRRFIISSGTNRTHLYSPDQNRTRRDA
jgi:hypothetical protein